MSSSSVRSQRLRAQARQSWPVKAFTKGEEPSENLSDLTTAEERLAMMWPLAKTAWQLAFGELPVYSRDQMPGRVMRRASKVT